MIKLVYKLLTVFILIPYFLTAQKVLSIDSLYFNPDFGTKPLSVINHNKEICLFFPRNGDGATSFLKYDKDFNLILKANMPRENYGHPEIRGYELTIDNIINLYFSSKNYEHFLVHTIYEDGKSKEQIFDLSLKDEKVIDAFNHNNIFYLLTYTKETSILNKYQFKGADYKKTSYDLFSKGFCEKLRGICDLRAVFRKNGVQFVNEDTPTTITQATNKIKIYPTDDYLLITADYRVGSSTLISLSSESNDFKIQQFGNSYDDFKEYASVQSNSFYFDGYLFQILASRRKGRIHIKNADNSEIVKTYSFNNKDNIYFNNSEIYEDKGSFSLDSEVVRNTKDFLNTLMKGNVGITVPDYRKA